MKAFFKAAIWSVVVAVVLPLKCYNCVGCGESLGKAITCPDDYDTCYMKEVTGFITRGCTEDDACQGSVCCKTDLCNGSVTFKMSAALVFITAIINIYFLH